MEQLVAREAHNLEVVGSSPTPATEKPSISRRFFYFLTAVFGFFSHFYCRRFYFLLLRCVSLNFRPSPDSPSPNYPPEDARFTSDYLFCADRHYSPLTLRFLPLFRESATVCFTPSAPSSLFFAFRKRPPVRNAKIRYNVGNARRRFSARPPIPVGERRRKTPRRQITRFTEFARLAHFVKIKSSRNLRKV